MLYINIFKSYLNSKTYHKHGKMEQRLTILEKKEHSRPTETSLLFVDHCNKIDCATISHSHPYWQMEFIISGTILAFMHNSSIKLKAGQALILPPGKMHSFKYPKEATTEIRSIKFIAENLSGEFQPYLLEDTAECRFLIKNLVELQSMKSSTSIYRIIESLAATVLDLHFGHTSGDAMEPSFIAKTRELTSDAKWQKITPAYVAKKIGYSQVHLSRLFKNKLGMTLKVFLDNERHKAAKRLLLYSDYSISEISEKLAHPDPFCFSRFFKRIQGMSPRDFRNSA